LSPGPEFELLIEAIVPVLVVALEVDDGVAKVVNGDDDSDPEDAEDEEDDPPSPLLLLPLLDPDAPAVEGSVEDEALSLPPLLLAAALSPPSPPLLRLATLLFVEDEEDAEGEGEVVSLFPLKAPAFEEDDDDDEEDEASEEELHLAIQSSMVAKLLLLPPHPPYVKIKHDFKVESK